MYSKAGTGYILVSTPHTHRVGTGKKGENGKEIIASIEWNPMRFALNYAEVYQLPVSMGVQPISQVSVGAPGYGPVKAEQFQIEMETSPSTDLYAIGGVYKYKTTADIEPDVQIGDRIYFKPRTLNNPANFIKKDKELGILIYKVPYENIFCAIRYGEVIPIGTWTLVEPIFEDFDSILTPTYYQHLDSHGNKVPRPKSQWLQKKVAPEHDNWRGIVKHVGKPYKGDHCDIQNGDLVVFKPKAAHFETIEGEKMIVMRQEYIMAKLKEDIKVK